MAPGARLALRVQGAFYLVTGLWPLASMRTFELVTGPKIDDWLVRTVGLILVVIAASLLLAARDEEATAPVRVLAVGTALALAAIDMAYVSARRISPVYLLDAAAEIALAVWLLAVFTWPRAGLRRRGRGASRDVHK